MPAVLAEHGGLGIVYVVCVHAAYEFYSALPCAFRGKGQCLHAHAVGHRKGSMTPVGRAVNKRLRRDEPVSKAVIGMGAQFDPLFRRKVGMPLVL